MPATVSEVLAATQEASTAVEFDLGLGESVTYIAKGLARDDRIVVEVEFSDGTFEPFTFLNSSGQRISAVLDKSAQSITIDGSIKGRLNKPRTSGSVKIDSVV